MFLGIDVGGTHTDAVLLRVTGDAFSVVAGVKVETNHADVVASVRAALDAVLVNNDPAAVARFTLSTTLTTNALAQGRFDDALLVLVPGPGINVAEWAGDLPVHVVSGAMDHRGRETQPLDDAELGELQEKVRNAGVKTVAVAGKFAIRNPRQENSIAQALRDNTSPDFVCLSHNLSGKLNFPRRSVAAFYNAALWRLHDAFADAVLLASEPVGNGREPMLLMAHGGSVPLGASRGNAVEAANSGPAASVLGILALEGQNVRGEETVLFCDIGGSTTDLALMAKGSPVTAREGLTLGGRRTSVPGLATLSVPIGGDSPVVVEASGAVSLGAKRAGPCLAMGGPEPTLTDALNVLGHAAWGDAGASLHGMREVASAMERSGGGRVGPEDAARIVAAFAGLRIRAAADDFVAGINARPVYTVAQLLHGATLVPDRICAVGGAGASMAATLEEAFGLPVAVPGHAAFANAIGAALARVSVFASLYADTARRVANLLPQGETLTVSSAYTLEDAVADVKSTLRARMRELEPGAEKFPVETVESDSFAMHDEYGARAGRTIRVLCRVKPGLITEDRSVA
ncbi:hydantoinase/oxoprolinase family protein [Desulfovibrio sp. OttesenSCG-928-O18]|nr:hydantoinase/oxoprolinase family protein [Desulfovibrio sp. OttesenSCG-928-O18]